ncbi:hypothetical protein [Rhodococcus zopfii]|uniref:hypothetical protein n=1 Tax=Rhodococcus zopfii TaxID=43772 RepID=UPI001FCFBC02|nr:hypothetical protein [Rhodococcus zopfii]
MADLDRFPTLGQRRMCGGVRSPRGLRRPGLAVRLGTQSIDALGLAGNLVRLDAGGGPVVVVDVEADGEPGGPQRGGGGGDLRMLGAPVPGLRDIPGPETSANAGP